jgi:hypothetical protein
VRCGSAGNAGCLASFPSFRRERGLDLPNCPGSVAFPSRGLVSTAYGSSPRIAFHRRCRAVTGRTMVGARAIFRLAPGTLTMTPWRRHLVSSGGFTVTIRTGRGGCGFRFQGGRR